MSIYMSSRKGGITKMGGKKYVITAAQASYESKLDKEGNKMVVQRGQVAKVNERLLGGLEKYCAQNDAELIILPMNGADSRETSFHPSVPEIYNGNKVLNSNIRISNMKVPPQNTDPTTGRLRFAQQDRTLIYPHSKQRFRAVPSSNGELPKLLITTGAITTPNYHESNHRGDVARRDHTYGAVVAEIIDDTFYNVRHIKALKNGTFIDMGVKYDGNKRPTKAKIEALVLGDLHVGDTDPKTRQANYEMIDFFKPKRLILHDVFNGHSINPHESKNLVSRLTEYGKGRLDLDQELRECGEELTNLCKSTTGKVYVVKSNHDVFLERYLEQGDFMKEPWNAEISLKLAYAMSNGEDPLEYGIRQSKMPKNLKFLQLISNLKVGGYQLASHGHKGNSGSRNASITARETAHGGKSITGHSHTPEILRDTYIVGTSTLLDLPYTDGSASSWMHANAVLYTGGQVQLIPIINGKWKRK